MCWGLCQLFSNQAWHITHFNRSCSVGTKQTPLYDSPDFSCTCPLKIQLLIPY